MKSYAFLHSLPNLRVLDLSHNRLQSLPEFGFSGLKRLTSLNLIGNVDIYRIEPFALHGLQSLKVFELVGANINFIYSNAFSGLRLDVLNLTSNKIKHIEDNIFNDLYAKNIYLTHTVIEDFNEGLFRGVGGLSELTTSEYKYCCIRPDYLLDENCFPKKDELSSCEDLLRLSALQTMVWLIGLCALFGNILSMIYRLVYHRERLQLGYEIFVTNLAVADTIMGIYLLIIAVADAMFRNRLVYRGLNTEKNICSKRLISF
jgi:leucine-rich repeat-containing G protein-coupled receptor 7/leucine-rich repeat-containing G protein-coupled receptor 8